jgi:hypothetical protein
MVANNEVEAVRTVELVFALIVEIAEEICEFVFALITDAREVEAVVTRAPNEVEAIPT